MNSNTHNAKELLRTFLRDISQKNKLNEVLENFLKDIKPIENIEKINEIPFTSERKYSACIYKNTTLILGAPEMLLGQESKTVKIVKAYTNESFRVVIFGEINEIFDEKKTNIKKKFKPLLIIALDDPIREETAGTLKKLAQENISYRIISGDSPDTVSAIARKINKDYPRNVISGEDLDKLKEENLEKAILEHNIFARIKPHQKQLIVRVLKKNKLFTIMIGDGVNDVLALKESDLGVAMNGGSSMAKDVADVVLLNNSFSTLPLLLYEGRRIITNIQTIANIYLIKNVSSISTILMLGFIGLRFPFDPRHVELSSLLVIGVPSFVLAFEKHTYATTDEGFIRRLLLFSCIVGFGNAIFYTILYTYYDLTSTVLFYSRSVLLSSVIFAGINNIILIYLQHYSIGEIIKRKIIVGLLFGMLMVFLLCLILPDVRSFFAIQEISAIDFLISFCFPAIGSMTIVSILHNLHLLQIDSQIAKKTEEVK
jgi:cation-transporting ATPase E